MYGFTTLLGRKEGKVLNLGWRAMYSQKIKKEELYS
jgi:hypothetical protein